MQTQQQRAAPPPAAKRPNDYAELKALVRAAGLFERRLGYYAVKITYTLALLLAGVVALFLTDNLLVRLADCLYLAVVYAQLGFLGHDVGHRQVFATRRAHELTGLLLGNLVLGMSLDWWCDKHNAHHANPNDLDMDPDLRIPILAFSPTQLVDRRPWERWVIRYQAFFFFPMLVLAGLDLQLSSIRFVWGMRGPARLAEAAGLLAHAVLYYGGLIWLLGLPAGLGFIVAHQALFGFFIGSVFAPNHKGMPTIDAHSDLDFLRKQVLTARNVRSHPVIDFWYGGLNYQIEHHLFPAIPRCHLRQAQAITVAFCQDRQVSYHETGVRQSIREILVHLYQIGAPLRAQARALRGGPSPHGCWCGEDFPGFAEIGERAPQHASSSPYPVMILNDMVGRKGLRFGHGGATAPAALR